MRVFWLISRCLGMLLVILICILLAARMQMLGSDTGNYAYLVLVLMADTAVICWAYQVIWKPIPRA